MITQSSKKSPEITNVLLQVAAGCCVGLVLGLVSGWLSPMLTLGLLSVLFLTYAILKRPEIALLGILIATSSIVYEDQLPMLSLGVSLHIPDILFLGLLGIIIVRSLAEPEFKIVHTPLDWPLLIFFGMTVLSTMVAFYQPFFAVEVTRRALRFFSYYLTFFVVTNLIRDRRQLNFLLNSLFILAGIVASAIVLQFLLGSSVQLLPGRVEALATQDTLYQDIARILPPGWSVVFVSFIAILCILVLEKNISASWLMSLFAGLLGLALALTFLRSYWAALLVVFLGMGYFFKDQDRKRYLGMCFVTLILAFMVISIASIYPDSRPARLVTASLDRFGTIFDSGTFQGEDGSLNWRKIENEYAISTIAENPWIGLGMGFRYRPWDPRLDQPDPGSTGNDFTRHIHNGHFWILLQSGILGYLSLLWLSVAFLLRGFRNWHRITDIKLKGVVLGFSLAYLAVFIAAVANSSFTQWRWTPIIGIMMGINEVILLRSNQNAG